MEPSLPNDLRLLLIDDDEDQYILLKKLVSNVNRRRLEIDWAYSSEQALLFSRQRSYDAFLVDYYLGPENGVEVIRKLVANGIKSPIILLTGLGNYEVDEAAQQAGAVDYLPKEDLTFSVLERSIRYALEHKNVQAELERRVQERTWDLLQEIEARKKAQAISRATEDRFRALTETTSAAIFIVRDMEIRYANPAVKTMTGFEPVELVDQNFINLLHPDYRSPLEQQGLGNPWAPGLPFRFEVKMLRRDGAERWLDLTTGPIEYEGQPAWIVTAFDITERDNAEHELQKARDELEKKVKERTSELRLINSKLKEFADESNRRAEEIHALHNATSMLLSTIDLEELLAHVVDAAQSAIPAAEKVVLYLLAPMSTEQYRGAPVKFKDPRIHFEEPSKIKGYPARVIQSREPLLLGQPSNVRWPSSVPGNGSIRRPGRSILAAPLIHEGEPFGALLLTSQKSTTFMPGDLDLLQTFAATAAVAIRNAQLYGRVQQFAMTDPLTGVLNRRGFFESSQRELERFHRYGHSLSMIFMDVDRLKRINDLYGHEAGDRVLQAVAKRSCRTLRDIDVMGRLGGDEFAILLPETSLLKAKRIAERIRKAVTKSPVSISRKRLDISATLGVATAKTDIPTMKVFLDQADQALYQAKQKGRNRIEVN